MILIDMHTHSTFSDGTFTPERLASAARKRGLSLLALTDHDTTSGLSDFMNACAKEGVHGLCGVELSADADFTLHILGYRFKLGDAGMEKQLDRIRKMRDDRNVQICEKLQAMYVDISIEEVTAAAGGEVVARPHFARLLTEKGYAGNIREAFDLFLKRGAPGYVSRERLSPEECIETIHNAGGLAVLAHPAQCRLDDDELESLLKRLKDAGLWGIEAVYGTNTPEITYQHLKLADKYGLYATAGSDFHGNCGRGVDLGISVSEDFLPWARLGTR